jgi:hypothetical protein
MKGQLSANLIATFSVLVTLLLGVITVRAAYDISDRGPAPQRSLQATYIGPSSPLDDLGKVPDISIEVESAGVALKNVIVVQTLLTNNGKSPILPSDIFEPLSISAKDPWKIVTLVNASSDATSIIKFKWTKVSDQEFQAQPALLNPGDAVWVNVYLTNSKMGEKLDEQFKKPDSIISWSGRVSNVKSISKNRDSNSINFGKYLFVFISDWGIPFFVFSFVLYFTLYYALLSQYGIFSPFRLSSFAIFTACAVICFCASDAGTTYVFGTFYGPTSNLLNAPILLANAFILGGLTYFGWRKRRGGPAA